MRVWSGADQYLTSVTRNGALSEAEATASKKATTPMMMKLFLATILLLILLRINFDGVVKSQKTVIANEVKQSLPL
jgi:hypothetical protein